MKTALVLSGGGALGSYEVGVWQALRKLHIKFDIVTGTSVGALNAIMVTQNDFHKCMNVWQDISFSNIYATKIDSDIKLNKLYQMHAKEFIKNGQEKLYFAVVEIFCYGSDRGDHRRSN